MSGHLILNKSFRIRHRFSALSGLRCCPFFWIHQQTSQIFLNGGDLASTDYINDAPSTCCPQPSRSPFTFVESNATTSTLFRHGSRPCPTECRYIGSLPLDALQQNPIRQNGSQSTNPHQLDTTNNRNRAPVSWSKWPGSLHSSSLIAEVFADSKSHLRLAFPTTLIQYINEGSQHPRLAKFQSLNFHLLSVFPNSLLFPATKAQSRGLDSMPRYSMFIKTMQSRYTAATCLVH